MPVLGSGLVVLISYMLDSIPTVLLIVRMATGKDICTVGSGRTGGTNARPPL
jgi:glycerol-3-phosphate acyltransferase PlsY